MWTQVEDILAEASRRSVESVAAFMPGMLALMMILLAAIVVAVIARIIVVRTLRSIDFDRRASQWGMGAFGDWSHTKGLSAFIARAVQWTILVMGLLTGLTALDAAMPLDQLGIGRQIVVLAFGLLFGGIIFAAALAIGLGAKDVVGRALERQI